MLYRRRRGFSGRVVLNLVVIGIISGVLFVVYDQFFRDDAPQDVPPATATASFGVVPSPVVTPLAPPTEAPTPSSGGVVTAAIRPAADATLFIPSVGVNAPVITAILRNSTWDVTELGTNVGYLQGTAWVSQPGNVVLSGHVEMSDGRTGVFASLDQIGIGDLVVITEEGQQHNYIVQEIFSVEPDDLSVVYPTPTDTLTLITCSDYNFLQNTYDTRLVVIATRA